MNKTAKIVVATAVIGTLCYIGAGYFKNNFIYAPSVVSYEAHGNSLQLYTSDGEGYYLELEEK